jgi:uncharacterized protein (TIGR02147 family)
MESIFSYTQYRDYLKDFFNNKKAEKKGYSLKVLSDRAGFKARDYILRIMKGTRNLSQSGALMLSKAMSLSEKEVEYFIALVGFNQAKTMTEKDHYFKKLSEVRPFGKEQRIRSDQYAYFSEWYHAAIRSLLPVKEFNGNMIGLAKTLYPPISPSQARKSVELLMQLGLLIQDGKGRYKAAEQHIGTGEEITSFALVQFHRKCLELARQSLDTLPPSQRDISGVTMSISDKALLKVKDEIKTFRKTVAMIAEKDSQEERVFQLCIQLFPMSIKRDGK